MATKGVDMSLVVVIMVILLCARANAQSGCTTAILGMSPCLNYISGNSSTPSSSCCSQLGSVVQSQPECLCLVLSGGSAALGFTLNQTQALSLPGACNLQTPPLSQCDAANGPTSSADSPTASEPVGSPADDTPADSNTIPSGGGGSKTVPTTTNASSSDSWNIKAPFHLVVFALFIASFASTITTF